MIKKHYSKYWTNCKTINRNYLHQCKANKASGLAIHLLDSLHKVKNTLSTTVLTKIFSLLNIRFLQEAIALRRIATKGSISLTINSADMTYIPIVVSGHICKWSINKTRGKGFQYICHGLHAYIWVLLPEWYANLPTQTIQED